MLAARSAAAQAIPLSVSALCCGAALVAGYLLGSSPSRKAPPKQAFVLLVQVTFASVHDRDRALRLWTPVARHCAEHEAGTLTYEAAISDSDPRTIVFLERYTSKDRAYLEIHKSSEPFLAFRAKLAEMGPEIRGHSYIATDIGYM